MSNPGLTYLKSWWKMDEASGTRYDESGSVNLTQSGGVGQTTGRYPDFGNKAAEFDPLNSEYLIHGTTTLTQIGPYNTMFGFWIKPHQISAQNPDIFTKWGDLTSAQEYIVHGVGQKIRFTVRDVNDGYFYVEATNFGNLSDNKWYFVCCYFQPYIVGVQTARIGVGVNDVWNTTDLSVYNLRQTTSDFKIGIRHTAASGVYFDGEMDDAFFYRYDTTGTVHPWTAANRTWLYNGGIGRRFEDVAQEAPPTINISTKRRIPEIIVYNSSLVYQGIIEEYSSLNWAERYMEEGDFELELPLSYADNSLLSFGNFLYIPTSDKVMVIEEKKPSRTPTDGKLLVNGRSAESLLRRRHLTMLNTFNGGSAEFYMYTRVYWSVINPADSDRDMSIFEDGLGNFIWPPAMETSFPLYEQYESENIYEVIESIAKIFKLGFKIICQLPSVSPKLYFLVYDGADRSGTVVFSDLFENLLDSSFLTTERDKINVTMVNTEDTVYPQVFVWLNGNSVGGGGTEPSGVNRFEGKLETTINRDTDDDDVDDMSDADCLAIIQKRGEAVIKENTPLAMFEGDVDARGQFLIEQDFFLGDIVTVSAHGITDTARIIEVVKSYSVDGEKIYITFDFEP